MRSKRTGIIGYSVIALAVALCWILFVSNDHLQEMLLGLGVVAAATLFFVSIRRSEQLRLEFRARDVLQCATIPLEILRRNGQITLVLLRDLFTRRRAGSFFRVCGFRCGRNSPVDVARIVQAITYTTVTPNFIVLGVDRKQGLMIFHQIERTPVPDSLRKLGAQP